MQVQAADTASASPVFTAKMACDARLPAQVMDVEMPLFIKRFTEVLAQDGPDGTTILWAIGDGTAKAVVTRSILHIPSGQ